jgi:dTDP-4-amino-4,6-dideoxygalactose transaminase
LADELIRLNKSSISVAEREAVDHVLRREYLGMGPKVEEFERLLRGYLNCPVAAVSSGTAALHLAIEACGIGPGDEVLIPTITYVASFQAVSATGATPVPVDINIGDLSISIDSCREKLSGRTKAVMPVHYAGGMKNLAEVLSFAADFDLRVIEDAAHAFGSKQNLPISAGERDIVCFSFDGIKNITCGEGGCIATHDLEILERVSDARLLGVISDTEKRFQSQRSWLPRVQFQGWRYHMSDVMAAIGCVQFERRGELFSRRKQLASLYIDQLGNASCGIKPLDLQWDSIVPHIFPCVVPSDISRDNLRENLQHSYGIQCGIHYYPNHYLEKYRSNVPLTAAEKVASSIISLPLHSDLDDADISYIVESVGDCLGK